MREHDRLAHTVFGTCAEEEPEEDPEVAGGLR